MIPESQRFPRERNGNPLQHFCLEKPMDRGAWQATVHGVIKSWTLLSNFTFFLSFFWPKYRLVFPGGSDGKESACSSGDPGSIPGLVRSPGKTNGNPLQYSCLENSMDRGAWQATVHGVIKNQTQLSD